MTLTITGVTARSNGTPIGNGSSTKFTEVTIRGTASEEHQAIIIYDGANEIFKTTSGPDLKWVAYPPTLEARTHKFKAKLQWDEEVSNEWVITVLSPNTH
jgi:hypothetical protein